MVWLSSVVIRSSLTTSMVGYPSDSWASFKLLDACVACTCHVERQISTRQYFLCIYIFWRFFDVSYSCFLCYMDSCAI